MRAFSAQVRLLLVEHLRLPAYIMASVGFPLIFFLIFAVPEAKVTAAANLLLASFLGFAILGVMFLQFAHGLAEERSSPWFQYVRTLPVTGLSFFASRMLVTWVVALLAALALTFAAIFTTPVELAAGQWAKLYFTLIVAGLCFAIMGMALGMWVSEKLALPLGNAIYLPLTYAGGLWMPPEVLPEAVRSVSQYLPTRAYGDLLWAIVKTEQVPSHAAGKLVIWAAVFALITYAGYHHKREA